MCAKGFTNNDGSCDLDYDCGKGCKVCKDLRQPNGSMLPTCSICDDGYALTQKMNDDGTPDLFCEKNNKKFEGCISHVEGRCLFCLQGYRMNEEYLCVKN